MDAAETTPAVDEPAETPAKETPASDDDYATGNPEDYEADPNDDTPMTAEELKGDGEPMDGDHGTDAESQNIEDYNECVADLEAEYEPDMGMTDDTSICDSILEMNNAVDAQFELLDGLDIPCVFQLDSEYPEMFEGRGLEEIAADPTVIRKCAL